MWLKGEEEGEAVMVEKVSVLLPYTLASLLSYQDGLLFGRMMSKEAVW